MEYRGEYSKKLIDAEEAVNLVESGMRIEMGGAVNFAQIIDKYLAQRKNELENVSIGTFIDFVPYKFLEVDPEMEVFKWRSGFIYASGRTHTKKLGVGVYLPRLYHDSPRIVRECEKGKIDIAFLVTTPMDKNGYFNFGLTCSHLKAFSESAKKVVVVVKREMPWIYGGYDECIHISDVDYIVEDEEFPLPSLSSIPAPSKEDKMIAENIIEAGLISDGSTLQVGIGGLPDTVMRILKESDFKELGLHTEMVSEGAVELIEEGIITNSNKKFDKNKSVFTFCIGTKKLYEKLDRNPSFAIYPVDYTNDPFMIAQQPKMFSLNQAMQVDLMGQVNSEQVGLISPAGKLFQVSGTGGQLDFAMGCLFSRDRAGKSVLALYSTYNGESRIVPILPAGSAVTVPRTIVQYIATEFGVAYMRGIPIRERAIALIKISNPDHRDWLTKEAQRLGIFPPKYSIPAGKPENVVVARD
ncbi:MAG: 4-hydroxybutyrate CoA-transferase [Archaeoglobaceae archaeon]|nr:4-hydroxybutyrate CoA-transferase [Archaeoglobaceae archaeon]MDW8127667.1 acetyl-CoA hydrolase/transferase C-terminal domain-containing protein [Archaeoglobaceae archaeon]